MMNILDQHIAGHLLKGYVQILLIFLSIFSLIVLVDEIDEVGRGRYTFWKASEYVLLTLPSRFVLLSPFVALLGSIMALGGLAQGRELTAMQAAGVSPLQIAKSVMKVGIVVMVIVACFQEYVNPHWDQEAILRRSVALSNSKAYKGKQGLWFREGSQFVNIQKIVYGEVPEGIDIFEFDKTGHMTMVLHAEQADINNPQKWVLKNVDKKMIHGQQYSQEFFERMLWDLPLRQDEMHLLTLPAFTLSLSELADYIDVLQKKNQNSLRYESAYWNKLVMPFTTGLMILVAFPFVFGPLRSSTVGKRMLLGSLAGIAYFLLSEVLEQVGLLMGVSPMWTTVLPFLCLGGVTLGFWRLYFW